MSDKRSFTPSFLVYSFSDFSTQLSDVDLQQQHSDLGLAEFDPQELVRFFRFYVAYGAPLQLEYYNNRHNCNN